MFADDAPPLRILALCRSPQLEEVETGVDIYDAHSHFRLPLSVRKVACRLLNSIPLAALTELVRPGPRQLPNLTHVHFDRPFGYCNRPFSSHQSHINRNLGAGTLVFPAVDGGGPREALRELFRVAEELWVELTGTCTAVIDYEPQALQRVHRASQRLGWGSEDEDEELDHIYAGLVSDSYLELCSELDSDADLTAEVD